VPHSGVHQHDQQPESMLAKMYQHHHYKVHAAAVLEVAASPPPAETPSAPCAIMTCSVYNSHCSHELKAPFSILQTLLLITSPLSFLQALIIITSPFELPASPYAPVTTPCNQTKTNLQFQRDRTRFLTCGCLCTGRFGATGGILTAAAVGRVLSASTAVTTGMPTLSLLYLPPQRLQF